LQGGSGTDVNTGVANDTAFVRQLIKDGAKSPLVLNVPDLDETPDATLGLVDGGNWD
jgi:hypothetical protein